MVLFFVFTEFFLYILKFNNKKCCGGRAWRVGIIIIILLFILLFIIVGRWRARGGQVYFRWATCKKVGPIFLFSKNLIIIFFLKNCLCVFAAIRLYILCVGVRSTTLLQFKVENALLRISFFRFY